MLDQLCWVFYGHSLETYEPYRDYMIQSVLLWHTVLLYWYTNIMICARANTNKCLSSSWVSLWGGTGDVNCALVLVFWRKWTSNCRDAVAANTHRHIAVACHSLLCILYIIYLIVVHALLVVDVTKRARSFLAPEISGMRWCFWKWCKGVEAINIATLTNASYEMINEFCLRK